MKKAVVVGASSGIGEGLAKLLVKNDYIVGITGRRADLLNKIRNENPDKYIVKSFDISRTDLTPQQLEELVNELGGLDLLIISSGTGEINKTLDFTIENRTINTNVLGFTAVADWAYNYFEKKKSGHLVAISSIAGLRGNRHAPSYSASKSYQISYLEALQQKAGNSKSPVFITDIRPGFVDTKMAQGDNLIWVSSVEKAVKQIYKAIQLKRKVAYITKRWAIIAIIMRLIPDWIYNKF
jgi:short-subunit dehydrogenase